MGSLGHLRGDHGIRGVTWQHPDAARGMFLFRKRLATSVGPRGKGCWLGFTTQSSPGRARVSGGGVARAPTPSSRSKRQLLLPLPAPGASAVSLSSASVPRGLLLFSNLPPLSLKRTPVPGFPAHSEPSRYLLILRRSPHLQICFQTLPHFQVLGPRTRPHLSGGPFQPRKEHEDV